jgi:metal-dependent hydrolase (beta-lactamase superfamily II)
MVIPIHCSGADFIEAMRRRMPKQLVTANVGMRITVGVRSPVTNAS